MNMTIKPLSQLSLISITYHLSDNHLCHSGGDSTDILFHLLYLCKSFCEVSGSPSPREPHKELLWKQLFSHFTPLVSCGNCQGQRPGLSQPGKSHDLWWLTDVMFGTFMVLSVIWRQDGPNLRSWGEVGLESWHITGQLPALETPRALLSQRRSASQGTGLGVVGPEPPLWEILTSSDFKVGDVHWLLLGNKNPKIIFSELK